LKHFRENGRPLSASHVLSFHLTSRRVMVTAGNTCVVSNPQNRNIVLSDTPLS
jgi:hypothetical protein